MIPCFHLKEKRAASGRAPVHTGCGGRSWGLPRPSVFSVCVCLSVSLPLEQSCSVPGRHESQNTSTKTLQRGQEPDNVHGRGPSLDTNPWGALLPWELRLHGWSVHVRLRESGKVGLTPLRNGIQSKVPTCLLGPSLSKECLFLIVVSVKF